MGKSYIKYELIYTDELDDCHPHAKYDVYMKKRNRMKYKIRKKTRDPLKCSRFHSRYGEWERDIRGTQGLKKMYKNTNKQHDYIVNNNFRTRKDWAHARYKDNGVGWSECCICYEYVCNRAYNQVQCGPLKIVKTICHDCKVQHLNAGNDDCPMCRSHPLNFSWWADNMVVDKQTYLLY